VHIRALDDGAERFVGAVDVVCRTVNSRLWWRMDFSSKAARAARRNAPVRRFLAQHSRQASSIWGVCQSGHKRMGWRRFPPAAGRSCRLAIGVSDSTRDRVDLATAEIVTITTRGRTADSRARPAAEAMPRERELSLNPAERANAPCWQVLPGFTLAGRARSAEPHTSQHRPATARTHRSSNRSVGAAEATPGPPGSGALWQGIIRRPPSSVYRHSRPRREGQR